MNERESLERVDVKPSTVEVFGQVVLKGKKRVEAVQRLEG